MGSPFKTQDATKIKAIRSPLKEGNPNNHPNLTKINASNCLGSAATVFTATQLLSGKKRSLDLLEKTEKVNHKRSKQFASIYGSVSAASVRSIEGAVLTSRQQTQRRAEQSKIIAKDLFDWQQNWRLIMRKDTRIYFDTALVDYKLEKRKELLKCGFSMLGARMKVFFDMDVTIVITSRKLDRYDNLPDTDVLYRAHKNGYMKIWNYDKATRFLGNLDVDLGLLEKQHRFGIQLSGTPLMMADSNSSMLAVHSHQLNNAATLSNLLENEKMYGPSDRDPRAKRDGLHYFKYPHVYLYDLWQTWAPLITVEWKPSELSDSQKLPYPTIIPGTFGRCPFVGDGNCDELSTRRITKRYKRDCLNEKYALKLRLIYQESAQPRLLSSIPQDEQPIMMNYSRQYPNSMTKYMKVMQIDDSKSKKPLPITLLTRQETTGEDTLANDDLCKHKSGIPQEIKASGINLSIDTNLGSPLVGNGLAPIKASTLNKNLKSLNRMVVDRNFTQQTITPQKTINQSTATSIAYGAKKTSSTREATLTPINIPTVTVHIPAPTKRPLQGKLGGGYCENCRVKYDHLDQHIRTEKHHSFAQNSMNFEKIDYLIKILREELIYDSL